MYTWVTTTTDLLADSAQRIDSVIYTVSSVLASPYLDRDRVTQVNGDRDPLYVIYESNGSFTRNYPSPFPIPDTYVPRPLWITFPFNGTASIDTVLLDTIDQGRGGLHLISRFTAQPNGSARATINGKEYRGYRVDYRFIYTIENEDRQMTINGTTLYLPQIGWNAWTIEETIVTAGSDVLSRRVARGELGAFVVVG